MMNISTSSLSVKIGILIVVLCIIKYLKLDKKWKKTSGLIKVFFIIIFCIFLYLLFGIPSSNNTENFGNPASCTYYYMDKCGYCEKFSPEWDEFSSSYSGPVKLSKKNMKDAQNEVQQFNIKGFPSVILVDKSGHVKEYDGPRTSYGLNNFFLSLPSTT